MQRTPAASPHRHAGSQIADRRAHRRLPLELHVVVQRDGATGPVFEKAITEDVSSGGLRFSTFNWRRLPVGARFRVTMSVPFESVMFTNRRQLTAVATVVRWIDEEDAAGRRRPPLRRGIAVRFDEPLTFAASA